VANSVMAVVGREAAIQAATLGAGNAITALRAARAARAAETLDATYALAAPAYRAGVRAYIRSAIAEFRASKGEFVTERGYTPINARGSLTFGGYMPLENKIFLFSSANQATLVEELIHFQQAKRLGLIGKSLSVLSAGERSSLESQAAAILRGLGFTPK
jgi:hypothetical protein